MTDAPDENREGKTHDPNSSGNKGDGNQDAAAALAGDLTASAASWVGPSAVDNSNCRRDAVASEDIDNPKGMTASLQVASAALSELYDIHDTFFSPAKNEKRVRWSIALNLEPVADSTPNAVLGPWNLFRYLLACISTPSFECLNVGLDIKPSGPAEH